VRFKRLLKPNMMRGAILGLALTALGMFLFGRLDRFRFLALGIGALFFGIGFELGCALEERRKRGL
jgi:hypothetical protein